MQIRERGTPGASPGFDDPLGLLAACHDRIMAHCATLVRLENHVRVRGFDAEACIASERVIQYFAEAGRWHHEDEERDLVPLLKLHADEALSSLLVRLMAEHRTLEAAYAPLHEALVARDLRLTAEPYVSLMRAHVAAENVEVLPVARVLLAPEEVAQLGAAMASRRGVRQGARGRLRDGG